MTTPKGTDMKTDAKIFSCDTAALYQPTNDKTILIRILDSFHKKLDGYPHFRDNFAAH